MGLAIASLWQSQIARQKQQEEIANEVQALTSTSENHMILHDQLNALAIAATTHQKLEQLSNVPESLKIPSGDRDFGWHN